MGGLHEWGVAWGSVVLATKFWLRLLCAACSCMPAHTFSPFDFEVAIAKCQAHLVSYSLFPLSPVRFPRLSLAHCVCVACVLVFSPCLLCVCSDLIFFPPSHFSLYSLLFATNKQCHIAMLAKVCYEKYKRAIAATSSASKGEREPWIWISCCFAVASQPLSGPYTCVSVWVGEWESKWARAREYSHLLKAMPCIASSHLAPAPRLIAVALYLCVCVRVH